MASPPSSRMPAPEAAARPHGAPAMPIPVKVIVAGGFGVGKTTMVAAISEIPPVSTEGAMTAVATGIDDPALVAAKTTTTVAMDFGRVTVDDSLVLYLFGTPGQDRFGFMWDDLCLGALGGVALVDLRRVEECFPALDYFEKHDVPFAVGVNVFTGTVPHDMAEIRAALDVDPDVPVLLTDARSKDAAKELLLALLDHVLTRAEAARGR
jgi:signal recognition particle receptor subunit beta